MGITHGSRSFQHAALAAGLKQLGFTPYDYVDRMFKGHFRDWENAIEAKFKGTGTPWGRREFDRLTGDFDVTNIFSAYNQ